MNNNNPKLVLFGSFTEEETRTFQKQSDENRSPSLGSTTYLQFGSFDFASVISSRDFKDKAGQPDLSVRFGSLCSSLSSPRDDNDKKEKIRKGNDTVVARSNGSVNGHLNPWDDNDKKETIRKSNDTMVARSNGSANGHLIINEVPRENGKVTVDLGSVHSSEVEGDETGLKLKTENGGVDGSKDATSTTKEKLSESETYLYLLDSASKENSQLNGFNKILDGEQTAMKPLLPHGLINSGNLCFLNATLQALLSCSLFVQLLQDLKSRDIPKVGYPTLQAFVEFISNLDMPNDLNMRKKFAKVFETGKPFAPVMFEAVLKAFAPDVPAAISARPRQEDAQEFLCFVMDRIHDELLRLRGHSPNSNGKMSSIFSSAEDDDGWETVGPKNKSALTRIQSLIPSELTDIFGGELKSVVKATGNKPSATVQPFLLLHLDIFPNAVHTIEDALHLFATPEALEGYKTSNGKASGFVNASKSVKIQKLSKILILHLMRFSYDSNGSTKLHKPVRFPLELVLSRELLVSSSSEGRKYELVGTITHHGRDPSKGHYTADARYLDDHWLRYDDSSVISVATSKVLHEQAYVLFYRQV